MIQLFSFLISGIDLIDLITVNCWYNHRFRAELLIDLISTPFLFHIVVEQHLQLFFQIVCFNFSLSVHEILNSFFSNIHCNNRLKSTSLLFFDQIKNSDIA